MTKMGTPRRGSQELDNKKGLVFGTNPRIVVRLRVELLSALYLFAALLLAKIGKFGVIVASGVADHLIGEAVGFAGTHARVGRGRVAEGLQGERVLDHDTMLELVGMAEGDSHARTLDTGASATPAGEVGDGEFEAGCGGRAVAVDITANIDVASRGRGGRGGSRGGRVVVVTLRECRSREE